MSWFALEWQKETSQQVEAQVGKNTGASNR